MNRALPLFVALLAGCTGPTTVERTFTGGGEISLNFTRTDGLGVDGNVTIEGATADEIANEGGAAFIVEETVGGERTFWSAYTEIADFSLLNSDLPCTTGSRLFVAVTHWEAPEDGVENTVEVGFFGTGIESTSAATALEGMTEGSSSADLEWKGDPTCGDASDTLGTGSVTASWSFDSAVTATVDATPE